MSAADRDRKPDAPAAGLLSTVTVGVEDQLGSGGMGSVYAARDPDLGRRVAIKVLHEHLASMQTRLLREGQAVAKLRHPNVVTIYDVGTEGDVMFIAMELIEGKTLRGWLAESRKPWRDVVRMLSAASRTNKRDFATPSRTAAPG